MTVYESTEYNLNSFLGTHSHNLVRVMPLKTLNHEARICACLQIFSCLCETHKERDKKKQVAQSSADLSPTELQGDFKEDSLQADLSKEGGKPAAWRA